VYLAWCGLEILRMLIVDHRVPKAWTGLRATLTRRFA
jgi:hypothetical protein